MQTLPHHYAVSAKAEQEGEVQLKSPQLPALVAWPPAEFDGPGDQWSPETLLTASLASCFILTFRAVARASHVQWQTVGCAVTGTLDRIEGATRFTHFDLAITLTIPANGDEAAARRAAERVDKNCLVSASLSATKTVGVTVNRAALENV